ncbi:hypothetical protein FH972_023627 [Carpinus fangiana]|uniref:Uncharacterized protein n=1 Tax=Carpinus fangiana TaxID=176857 RepID=A0A5N6KVQ3_9ROSI|nr:hypothetical protein FH972_023627 [Carpinus fangiana]
MANPGSSAKQRTHMAGGMGDTQSLPSGQDWPYVVSQSPPIRQQALMTFQWRLSGKPSRTTAPTPKHPRCHTEPGRPCSPIKAVSSNIPGLRPRAQADVSMDDQKMDHALRPAHVRHCIDMLRQSLMCRPDLTVELVDPAIKASKGFGTRHECQNYGQLLHFMEHWESWKGGADAFVGMGED